MSLLRFIQLADTQLGMAAHLSGKSDEEVADYASRGMKVQAVPKFEGFEAESRAFEMAVDHANRIQPEFVVVCGDMINDCSDTEQRDEIFRISSGLSSSIQIYWVPGNHDVCEDTLVPTPAALSRYRRDWGDDYYAFQHGDVSFITLDSSVFDHPEMVAGELESQMAFLEAELKAAKRRESRHTIVFTHHPFFLEEPNEPDHYFNIPVAARIPALNLMKQYGVSAIMAGHLHRNNYASGESMQMVTTGAVGYSLGDDPTGYRVVDVQDEEISHNYYALGQEPT